MKKKLKGLFALWLAFAVLMSSAQALAENVSALLYTGNGELQLGVEVSTWDRKWLDNGLELDTPLNTQEFAQNIAPPGYIFTGWRLWSYFSSGAEIKAGPIEKAADGTVSNEEYKAYGSGPDDLLIEPKLKPKYRISEQPSAANGYTVTAQENKGTDTPDWQDTDNAHFQWYNAAVTPNTFYVVDENAGVNANEIGAYIQIGSYSGRIFSAAENSLGYLDEQYDNKYGIMFSMQSDSDEPLFLAGEKITITALSEFEFNSELAEIGMYDMLDNLIRGTFTESNGAYTYTFEKDVFEVHILFFSDLDGATFDAQVTAEKPSVVKTPLSGETSASLANSEAGKTYICDVTFDPMGDNVTLSSDSVTVPHSHDMSVECGQENAVNFEHALTSEDGKLYIDGTVLEPTVEEYSTYINLPDGSYYLADDVTLTNYMEIHGNVNLCLNGHTLDMGEGLIEIAEATDGTKMGDMKLCDCGTGGKITGTQSNSSSEQTGTIENRNEFSMYGGTVENTGEYTDSYSGKHGGGKAVVAFGGVVRLYGGTVTSAYDSAVMVDFNKGAAMHLSGAPKIKGAVDKADIYLDNEYREKIITLDAPLTITEPYRVAAESENTFTSGWETQMPDANFSNYFVSVTKGKFINKENNELKIFDYAITEQPSAENDYTITANGAPDYAPIDYKWFGAEVVIEDITTDNASVVTLEFDGSGTSSYDADTKAWTGADSNHDGTFYFKITLNKGDIVKVKPSKALGEYGSVMLEGSEGMFYTRETNSNGEYEIAVEENGEYTLSVDVGLSDDETSPTVTADVTRTVLKGEVNGQTAAQFTGGTGTYLCSVTYADGTVLKSDVFDYTAPVTHSHDMSVSCGHDNGIAFDKVLTADEDGWLCINGVAAETEDSLFSLSEGNYYLADNLSLCRGIIVRGDVNLCLNGKTLEFMYEYYNITAGFSGECNFNICDCGEGGKITGGYSSDEEYLALIDTRKTMSLYGGTIENSSEDDTDGYYQHAIANVGTLNLYGGEVVSKNDNAIVSSYNMMKINLFGNTKIKGADSAADIFLYKSNDQTEHGRDEYLALLLISNAFANAGLTEPYRVSADSVDKSADFTRGWGANMGDKEIGKYFVSAMTGYDIKKNTNGELEFVLAPSPSPSASPDASPSTSPSASPDVSPSVSPSVSPDVSPSASPSVSPDVSPSVSPTATPTAKPKRKGGSGTKATPTPKPTATPTVSPTAEPDSSPEPTGKPSDGDKKHKAYIVGYDGYFYPDGNITRAEVSAILARLTDDFDESGSYTTGFADVDSALWYAKYIGFAESKNTITGYTGDTFKPEESITRAEFASMITRFANLDAENSDVPFTDISGHWAAEQIKSCYNAGYIKGYEDNSFLPDNSITRAEAVAIINRMLDRNDIKEFVNPFSDVNESHWAYMDIMEAAVTHNAEN